MDWLGIFLFYWIIGVMVMICRCAYQTARRPAWWSELKADFGGFLWIGLPIACFVWPYLVWRLAKKGAIHVALRMGIGQ